MGTDSKKEQKRFQNGNAALEKYLAGVYDIEKGGISMISYEMPDLTMQEIDIFFR